MGPKNPEMGPEDTGLGPRIHSVRQEQGLSLAEFGSELGINLQTVRRFERGERTPGADIITRMFEVFGTDPLWLLTGRYSDNRKVFKRTSMCPVLKEAPLDLAHPPEDLVEDWLCLPGLPEGSIAMAYREEAMAPLLKWGDLVVVAKGEPHNLAALADPWGELRIRKVRKIDGEITYLPENPEYRSSDDRLEFRYLGQVKRIVRDIP